VAMGVKNVFAPKLNRNSLLIEPKCTEKTNFLWSFLSSLTVLMFLKAPAAQGKTKELFPIFVFGLFMFFNYHFFQILVGSCFSFERLVIVESPPLVLLIPLF
jgi:hypothetical protein